MSLAYVSLTPVVIEKLPRGAGNGAVRAAWEKAGVEKTWENSAWAQNRERSVKRKQLTDFERFKVMRLRKQVRFECYFRIMWRERACAINGDEFADRF